MEQSFIRLTNSIIIINNLMELILMHLIIAKNHIFYLKIKTLWIKLIKIENQIRYEENLKNYNHNMEQMIKLHNIDTTKTFDEWKKGQQDNNIAEFKC